MKQCSSCKQIKPVTEFNKKSSNKDGLERYCKECHREKNRNHYADNKQMYIDSARKWQQDKIKWWEEYKKQFKCVRCGDDKPWRLDFHHIDPSTKEKNIAQMISDNRSREAVLNEISKCIPVCRNCHADIHYEQNISQ